MSWWQIQDLIITVAASLAVLIPVTGLTLRFALKPFLKDLSEMRAAKRGEVDLLRAQEGDRLERIENQLDALERSLRHLAEVVQFDRQLKPAADARSRPDAEPL